MKKSFGAILLVASVMAMLAVGCSNKPSAEELQQLEALKAETASLEKQISALESEKASLIKALAEKDARLDQRAKDKALVEQRLKAMQ